MATAEASSSDAMDKKKERMERFRALNLKRNEARKMNLEASKEEERIQKLPANYQAKRRRVEWEVEDEAARKEAEEAGEDYDRLKMLDCGADEVVRIERKRKKKNPDPGFSTYEDATIRQYQRLTKQMQPDLDGYKAAKEKLGDAMYPDADALPDRDQDKVSKEGVDRMVADLDKQIEKREKFSRRRAFHDEADINYINERNMRFNKKAERFYGKYTAEIKQNLERGTAV
ncbi:pre-mRNA-splicing factor syf2-like [Sycon ciliatum]|uniref:pre-mRNA-splicing factor syf2-like n=1 Tax=Sycon ciliatum TaxID=27933 RepID=UPI0020A9E791|eukprot:scpid73595/ scgid32463/ Pre-mRNA-splicing factor syf2